MPYQQQLAQYRLITAFTVIVILLALAQFATNF